MKIKINTWDTREERVIEIPVNKIVGFSFDGGRLCIDGYDKTIYTSSNDFSVEIVEE